MVWLGADYNNFSVINLNTLQNLEVLGVGNNSYLQIVNFSDAPSLKWVTVASTNLVNLDFSNNPNLEVLYCKNMPNLQWIKINNNYPHNFFSTIPSINQCWSNLPQLAYICVDDATEATNLQTFLTGCGFTQAVTIDINCTLFQEEFSLKNIKITPNPSQDGIYKLDIHNFNNEVFYDVYNFLGQNVVSMKKLSLSNPIIDLSNMPSGVYFLKVHFENANKSVKLIKK